VTKRKSIFLVSDDSRTFGEDDSVNQGIKE